VCQKVTICVLFHLPQKTMRLYVFTSRVTFAHPRTHVPRRVYTNETVNSIVSADVMKVEFDVHQREVYGEWGFQWIQPHLLAAFNLSGVECEYPCPAEMCEEGPVSPPPRLHELAYEYDGELLFVLMAKGLVPYIIAWTSLCVLVGLVYFH